MHGIEFKSVIMGDGVALAEVDEGVLGDRTSVVGPGVNGVVLRTARDS